MTIKSKAKDIIELAESKGWSHVNEVMRSEILTLALSMAHTQDMTQQQMDFKRGAIFAAEQLLNLPERLIHKFEGELSLEEATSRQGRSERIDNG
jgi:hypothetical protein